MPTSKNAQHCFSRCPRPPAAASVASDPSKTRRTEVASASHDTTEDATRARHSSMRPSSDAASREQATGTGSGPSLMVRQQQGAGDLHLDEMLVESLEDVEEDG